MEKSVSTRKPRQTKKWVCDTCGKMYVSNALLEEHANVHQGARPHACGVCGKSFASTHSCASHEKTHQAQPKPFVCEQCGKSFTTKQNLNYHQQVHSNEKNFLCDQCDKQFNTWHSLRSHSFTHRAEKPHACTFCDKAFARKSEIRNHLRTHTGERPFQCEFCGATFTQCSNLQSHKRASHLDDRRFKCTTCQEGFKRRRLLNYHIKAKHTHEKDLKCEVCEVRFIYPDHLRKHRIIHTGLKPFVCEVCGKAFNNKENKKTHLYLHSETKPYECLVCGSGFMRKKQIIQHIEKENHPNETILMKPVRLRKEDVATVNLAKKKNHEDEQSNKQTINSGTDLQKIKDEECEKVKKEPTNVFIRELKDTDLQILSNDTILINPPMPKTDDNHVTSLNSTEQMDVADDTILKEIYIYTEDQQGNKQTVVNEAIEQRKVDDYEYEEVEERKDFFIEEEHDVDLERVCRSKEFQEMYVTQDIEGAMLPMVVEFTNETGRVEKAWISLIPGF